MDSVSLKAGPFGHTDHGTSPQVNVFDGRVQSAAVLAVLELPHDLRTGGSPLNTYKRPESVRIERGSSVWSCPSTCSPAHVCFPRVAFLAPAAFLSNERGRAASQQTASWASRCKVNNSWECVRKDHSQRGRCTWSPVLTESGYSSFRTTRSKHGRADV